MLASNDQRHRFYSVIRPRFEINTLLKKSSKSLEVNISYSNRLFDASFLAAFFLASTIGRQKAIRSSPQR
jgi:hypothetical protein